MAFVICKACWNFLLVTAFITQKGHNTPNHLIITLLTLDQFNFNQFNLILILQIEDRHKQWLHEIKKTVSNRMKKIGYPQLHLYGGTGSDPAGSANSGNTHM